MRGKFEITGEGRRLAALLLSVGVIQIAAYYLGAAIENGCGSLATPQQDTLLYCQAARRIVEGHPFSFSAGTAVSTGTTSILYPFLLAVPYAMGFTEGALVSVGFWLNAAFYLIFLSGWSLAFRFWLPARVAKIAALLLALFPQTAFCALAQSDTGLWMALSGLMAWALVSNRRVTFAALLCLGPWVRPEGMIVIAVFLLFAGCFARKRLIEASFGVLSALGVFALNAGLTGDSSFASVANKGFFSTLTFPEAVRMTALQLISMFKEFFVGLSASYPRGFYFIPFFGAVALWLGFGTYRWSKHEWSLPMFCCAAAGGFLVVAQSGWQGTNSDRYLAWIMPLFVLFGASGWCWAQDRFSGKPWARYLLALPITYSALASCVWANIYHLNCRENERMVRFAHDIDNIIPANASIGAVLLTEQAYYLGNRRLANLCGTYSPEFLQKGWVEVLEILKNEPETRFDYWLLTPAANLPVVVLEQAGKPVLSGPNAIVLKKSKWELFDRAAKAPEVKGCQLKCRVDVGYERDERKVDYEIVYSYGMRGFSALVEGAPLNDGELAVDCGRLVIGYDEMTVDGLEPGRDVVVIARVMDRAVAESEGYFGDFYKTEYSFTGENGMHVAIDSKECVCAHFNLKNAGFTDVTVKIPGRYIASSRHRIRFHGDHAAFGYWFYQ